MKRALLLISLGVLVLAVSLSPAVPGAAPRKASGETEQGSSPASERGLVERLPRMPRSRWI